VVRRVYKARMAGFDRQIRLVSFHPAMGLPSCL